jgi:hypothetical protein
MNQKQISELVYVYLEGLWIQFLLLPGTSS